MLTIFHIKADELDENFLDSIKALYRDKQIEIIVSESDETAYLQQNEANRSHLMKAIANIESGENLVIVKDDLLP